MNISQKEWFPLIVSFSVANYRSFSTEETFSLAASNRLSGSHDDHVVPIPNCSDKVLRAGVLYGANGAGKSNLFKALSFMKRFALGARKSRRGTGREAFRLGETTEASSSFDLQFVTAGKLYRFGFKVDDDRVTEEWLAEGINGREIAIYERATDSDGKVTIELSKIIARTSTKLVALATVGGPQNQSFLATVNLTLDQTDHGELGAVLRWFKDHLKLIGPSTPFGPLGAHLHTNASCRTFASEFLKSVSTGIDHLEVSKHEISEVELRALLPEDNESRLLKDRFEEELGPSLIRLKKGTELLVERTPENRFYRITTRAMHRDENGSAVPFELADESDGTRRLLNLIPALHGLQASEDVYFIDEIDRSLHPNLVREFISFFLTSCHGSRSQVIVTTHESNLLDLDLLRRDEIWFAEKDHSSSTRLYSLTDFKVRNDLEIRKHYLNGRFGAIPFLGDLDRLLVEKAPAV